MMYLYLSYDDKSELFSKELERIIASKYPLVKLTSYHENLFKERKKSFKLKGGFSAKQNPFAVLKDSENNPIKAFYSESGDCTLDNIINVLNKYMPYESKSN